MRLRSDIIWGHPLIGDNYLTSGLLGVTGIKGRVKSERFPPNLTESGEKVFSGEPSKVSCHLTPFQAAHTEPRGKNHML